MGASPHRCAIFTQAVGTQLLVTHVANASTPNMRPQLRWNRRICHTVPVPQLFCVTFLTRNVWSAFSGSLETRFATRNKCIASNNKCHTTRNKKVLETSLLVATVQYETTCFLRLISTEETPRRSPRPAHAPGIAISNKLLGAPGSWPY